MDVGSSLIVTAEKFVASGLCLSRSKNGQIIFVDGLIPGEQADIIVTSKKRGTYFGEIRELLVVSAHRVEPPCPYVSKGCGGCDWQHIDIEFQRESKRSIVCDALGRLGGIKDSESMVEPTRSLSTLRYRTSTRVVLQGSRWGFRKRSSHDLVSIDDCIVLDDRCVDKARKVAVDNNDKKKNEHQIRLDNFVLGNKEMAVSTKSFYQSHIDAPEVLSNLVLESISDCGDNLMCVDLYSGVGIFALALAQRGHSVISVEGNLSASKDAKENLKGYSATVICSDVKDYRYSGNRDCDVVIADPSREGLGKDALQAVLSCGAKRIVLISCDPASGARDISMLKASGYNLDKVMPVDMFGHTHHVEMVSVLSLKH